MDEAVNALERELKRIVKDLEFTALSYDTDFKSRYVYQYNPLVELYVSV